MTWREQMSSRDYTPGQRIRILIARCLGVGFLGYLVVSVPGFVEGSQILAAWWTPLAVLLVFAPGALLLVTALVRPGLTAASAGAAACGITLAAVLWFLAWNGEVLPGSARGSWMSAFAGLAGLCATLAWRPVVTFVIQFVTSTTIAALDQIGLFGRGATISDIVYASTWSFGLCGLLTTAVIMALRTGAILDGTRESLERSAAVAAAAGARERERARFDALIHDQVLSTLLSTAREDPSGRLVAEARSALAELDRIADDSSREATVSADVVVSRLSSLAADAGLALSLTVDDGESRYPGPAAAAIVGATAEAVRNSVMHAGPGAERRLEVELRPGLIDVCVVDDGVGFDSPAHDSGRLGIEISIIGRMAQLDGGTSEVRSRPGDGTTVKLGWRES